ncbi:MAG TPA: D-aminoacylase [Pyrinomonadaceae bacterium]|nr:D-aminoacylase [Pyrinomonadaceae bacterium]
MKICLRKICSAFLCALVLVSFASAQTASFVIKNATIIDGSGKASFQGDVRVKNGKIAKIGNIKPKKDEQIIDANGKILAPGFIDIHNHSEEGIVEQGTATNQVSQGITTILIGPDGGSPFPIADYLNKLNGKIAPNVGAFIGHASLREQVMNGDYARKTTSEELAKMLVLIEQAMKDGAFGLSSGLEYDVGYSASTEELIALSKIAAKYKGIYMTHMRDEEEVMLDAVRESIRIGKEAKIPVQISHIKMGNKNVWGKSVEAIQIIETERKNGFDVTADAYPYTAWGSTITVLVPSRKHEDRQEVETGLDNVGGAKNVLITSCAAHRDYQGKTLEEIAKMQNVSPVDVYIQIVKDGGAGVVCNSMNETDIKNFYQQSWVMVSSDGGIGGRHPRGTGTFPRVLGRFVRENKWLTLEEAIYKMSAFPAQRLGLKDRGTIKKGRHADLVLLDKDKVIDRNTFTQPETLSDGIEIVFVNGEKVWENGKVTGKLPGMILKK